MSRKSTSASRPLTAKQAVALLDNAEFRAAAQALVYTAGTGSTPERALEEATKEQEEKRTTFSGRWGVVRPPNELINREPRRPEAAALLAGRWGLIRVFPWTTERAVTREFRRLRASIERAKRVRLNAEREALARWLTDCGFASEDILAVVWNQRSRRGRRGEGLSIKEEQRRFKKLVAEGKSPAEAERQLNRQLQKTESTAAPVIRMALSRGARAKAQRHDQLQAPLEADPVSGCLMKILRLKYLPAGLPMTVPATFLGEHLDPLLDELRNTLLAP